MHSALDRWFLVVILVVSLRVQFVQTYYNEPQLSNISNKRHVHPLTVPALKFIVQYCHWRRLDHVIIFDSYIQRGNIPGIILQLIDCLSQQGIYSSVYSTHVPITKDIFRIKRHRLGVVVLFKHNETLGEDHILYKASQHSFFDEQYAWLVITNDSQENVTKSNVQQLSLSLLSDLVIATATNYKYNATFMSDETKCPLKLTTSTYTAQTFDSDPNIFRQPSTSQQNRSAVNVDTNNDLKADKMLEVLQENSYFELMQVYKIRKDNNKSLVYTTLGSWGMSTNFERIIPFIPVENRQDLRGFPLVAGYKNMSLLKSGNTQDHSDVDDFNNLQEIMSFIAKSLNTTVQYQPYDMVGTEVHDGVWSDLMNAVVTGEVDIGLEKVTVSFHKLDYMAFTHNIIQSSHNIYMHPSEFSVSKDIYLTPFSPKLLLCVLAMGILLAIIMLLVSAVANLKSKKKSEQIEPVSASYAALWIVGILSMQGSVWTPVTSSGNMTLISSLIFALLIYNSYAAFITSILSVKSADINSLHDLFANGYKVGYIENSLDEIFLQKQSDELKTIYLRGYESRVTDIETGLLLAANTRYALFVSTQRARRAIHVLTPYECRCQIQEFVLRSTVEDVALPLSKESPYHKIINLGVMRLKESGTLRKIQDMMLPNMPMCSTESSFVSAQLEDVITAVRLLLAGIILAVVVAIAECTISYRRELKLRLKQNIRNIGMKMMETVESFEF